MMVAETLIERSNRVRIRPWRSKDIPEQNHEEHRKTDRVQLSLWNEENILHQRVSRLTQVWLTVRQMLVSRLTVRQTLVSWLTVRQTWVSRLTVRQTWVSRLTVRLLVSRLTVRQTLVSRLTVRQTWVSRLTV